jgi:hypothetical protein
LRAVSAVVPLGLFDAVPVGADVELDRIPDLEAQDSAGRMGGSSDVGDEQLEAVAEVEIEIARKIEGELGAREDGGVGGSCAARVLRVLAGRADRRAELGERRVDRLVADAGAGGVARVDVLELVGVELEARDPDEEAARDEDVERGRRAVVVGRVASVDPGRWRRCSGSPSG